MSDRDDLIRSLGTITLEAGWIDVCGDLGDLLDGLLAAGWRVPVDRSAELLKNWREVKIAPGIYVAIDDDGKPTRSSSIIEWEEP